MLAFLRQISIFRLNQTYSINFLSSNQFVRHVSDANVLTMFKQKPTIRHVSSYDSNAKYIISALQNNDYNKVRVLAKTVNINSHDFFENTPLTDAANRGDNKAIQFLVEELKADLHATCHCPDHKTALHYASENGHTETVKLLLKLGADPKLKDSRQYTSIDVAKGDNVKQILTSHSKEQYKLLK